VSFASDVPVSLPAPVRGDANLIDMYGFCLTEFGVRPALSAADHEHLSTLQHAAAPGPTVWHDAHLEGR
jgi:hypothetical protein